MLFAYLDESGDPGFTKLGEGGTSEYFVLALLFLDDPLEVANLVTEFKARFGTRALEELKYSNSSAVRRHEFLKELRTLDIAVGAVAINKAVVIDLPVVQSRESFYEEIVCQSVRHFRDFRGGTKLTLDEYVRGKRQKAFSARLRQRVNDRQGYYLRDIRHEKSDKNALLQATDMVSGAVYRARARGDSSLLRIIQPRIHELWDWTGAAEEGP